MTVALMVGLKVDQMGVPRVVRMVDWLGTHSAAARAGMKVGQMVVEMADSLAA